MAYSDSEGSEDEQVPQETVRTETKQTTQAPRSTNFAVDKSNPNKIRVNLRAPTLPSSERSDGEPAAKRPRVGGGAFSGFNAMLPAPKRDNQPVKQQNGNKGPARKVFSLKTGAEPAFSRESDAELRQLFTEQESGTENDAIEIPESIPKPSFSPTEPPQTTTGKPFLFKPLSVARNNKKKRPLTVQSKLVEKPTTGEKNMTEETLPEATKPPDAKKKVNLFSSGAETTAQSQPETEVEEDEVIEVLDDDDYTGGDFLENTNPTSQSSSLPSGPQSLDTIASDLNLSAADKRQLFGRAGTKQGAHAHNIINFNTDMEYASNEAMRQAGEQVQHNPVRSIAPGKHSLKQLVASAQGQKDALEESFATGRRNKKEAGSKYGW